MTNALPLPTESVQLLGLLQEPYRIILEQCAQVGRTSEYQDNDVSCVRDLGVTMCFHAKCVAAGTGFEDLA